MMRRLGLVAIGVVAVMAPAAARAETVVLDRTATVELGRLGGVTESEFGWRAPHFMRQVRTQLWALLCEGALPPACAARLAQDRVVVSSLDWEMQKSAARLVRESVTGEHGAYAIQNAALAALDYRTGEVLAWVGSASFDAPASAGLQPQFDVLAQGWRQPASAFKPFVYLAGIEAGAFTPATRLNDTAVEFEPGFAPHNADGKEHGRVRVREALRHSLNIPAVEASRLAGPAAIRELAVRFGLAQAADAPDPGLAEALGVTERRPADMLAGYAALANGGLWVARRFIRTATAPGRPAIAPDGATRRACSAEGAFLMTSLLASGRIPDAGNRAGWALPARGAVREVVMKTGTSSGARDMNAYGYLAPPTDPALPALAVGVWMGNSDGSPAGDTLAAVTAVPLWRAFVTEVSRDWPVARFGPPPAGVVNVAIDAATGDLPTAQTRETLNEWFLRGTEPRGGASALLAAPKM